MPTGVHINQRNWRRVVAWWNRVGTQAGNRAQKNMKLSSLSDTSTATKTWKTQPHKANISNIIIFNTQDVSKFHGTKPPWPFHFHWKWKPRILLSLIPAQPIFSERERNTKQMLVTSNKKLIDLYKASYHSQGVLQEKNRASGMSFVF